MFDRALYTPLKFQWPQNSLEPGHVRTVTPIYIRTYGVALFSWNGKSNHLLIYWANIRLFRRNYERNNLQMKNNSIEAWLTVFFIWIRLFWSFVFSKTNMKNRNCKSMIAFSLKEDKGWLKSYLSLNANRAPSWAWLSLVWKSANRVLNLLLVGHCGICLFSWKNTAF